MQMPFIFVEDNLTNIFYLTLNLNFLEVLFLMISEYTHLKYILKFQDNLHKNYN